MPHAFDPGYCTEPFRTLCAEYPESNVYPSSEFRLEWGPIFHRGRLDGSARILVIGQDPAQHETVIRRVLVGEAGRRLQGLLGKLGITKSYTIINTYLYSVYGNVKAKTSRNADLIAYRHRWIDALTASGKIEGVIALGGAADQAWQTWKQTPNGSAKNIAYAPVTHPTQPESSAKNEKVKVAAATKAMLKNWNAGLAILSSALQHRDDTTPFVPYGETWAEADRLPIPEFDIPAGLPSWMHEQDGWADRKGTDPLPKRRNITITVPKGVIP